MSSLDYSCLRINGKPQSFSRRRHKCVVDSASSVWRVPVKSLNGKDVRFQWFLLVHTWGVLRAVGEDRFVVVAHHQPFSWLWKYRSFGLKIRSADVSESTKVAGSVNEMPQVTQSGTISMRSSCMVIANLLQKVVTTCQQERKEESPQNGCANTAMGNTFHNEHHFG